MKRFVTLLFILLLAAAMLVLPGCAKKQEEEQSPKVIPPNEIKEPQVGLFIEKVNPVAVVINNHPEARPQSGLQHATIVYEFLAEGGITRLLAIFDTTTDVVIGPIRSLRPYFAVQAIEHGGIIAHSGYSDRTKDIIKSLRIREITSSTYLSRDSSRKAPHNLYTSIYKLYQARGESPVTKITPNPPNMPPSEGVGTTIEVNYSSANKVSYQYNEAKETYLRFVNGKPHTDRETKKQCSIRRVILRKNVHTNVSGTNLVNIDLAGSGQATLYELGNKYEIRWQKSNGTTSYTFSNGTPVDFTLGNTWIQVVR